MNDVRNLMHTLGGDVEYREFGASAAAAASSARSWALLQRLALAANDPQDGAPDPSAPVAQGDPQPPPRPRATAAARSGRGLSLGRYAANPAAGASTPSVDEGRSLPLTEVFARLARSPR